MALIHTLNLNNKIVAVRKQPGWYVIGFKSIYTARHVHYNLPPDPYMYLSREFRTLTIEKLGKDRMGIMDPVQDVGYHLNSVPFKTFAVLPFEKQLGLIIIHGDPDDEEDTEMFKFKNVQVVDPSTLYNRTINSS